MSLHSLARFRADSTTPPTTAHYFAYLIKKNGKQTVRQHPPPKASCNTRPRPNRCANRLIAPRRVPCTIGA
ncbi:hypothetical protein F01_520012 [Burkholderia cenocepacia]|nr:hypothetical protein F01_520012 [Burkholderia cenocepacia]